MATIRISEKARRWWKKCCKAKGLKSELLMDRIMEVSKNKRLFDEYVKTLPVPSDFVPPLTGCKLKKCA